MAFLIHVFYLTVSSAPFLLLTSALPVNLIKINHDDVMPIPLGTSTGEQTVPQLELRRESLRDNDAVGGDAAVAPDVRTIGPSPPVVRVVRTTSKNEGADGHQSQSFVSISAHGEATQVASVVDVDGRGRRSSQRLEEIVPASSVPASSATQRSPPVGGSVISAAARSASSAAASVPPTGLVVDGTNTAPPPPSGGLVSVAGSRSWSAKGAAPANRREERGDRPRDESEQEDEPSFLTRAILSVDDLLASISRTIPELALLQRTVRGTGFLGRDLKSRADEERANLWSSAYENALEQERATSGNDPWSYDEDDTLARASFLHLHSKPPDENEWHEFPGAFGANYHSLTPPQPGGCHYQKAHIDSCKGVYVILPAPLSTKAFEIDWPETGDPTRSGLDAGVTCGTALETLQIKVGNTFCPPANYKYTPGDTFMRGNCFAKGKKIEVQTTSGQNNLCFSSLKFLSKPAYQCSGNCDNGTPVETDLCTAPDQDRCLECRIGYDLADDFSCKPKISLPQMIFILLFIVFLLFCFMCSGACACISCCFRILFGPVQAARCAGFLGGKCYDCCVCVACRPEEADIGTGTGR